MHKAVDLVRAFYAAVSRADAPAIIGLLHTNLRWTEAEGFPYYGGTWCDPQEVLDKLFVPLMSDWDNFVAIANEFIAEGDRVVALGAYSGIYRKTQKTMRTPFAHVWQAADGKLIRFEMYADTFLFRRSMDP